MPRFITELLNPYEKCRRVGHKVNVVVAADRVGFQYLRMEERGFGQRKTVHMVHCKRCHAVLTVHGYVTEAPRFAA